MTGSGPDHLGHGSLPVGRPHMGGPVSHVQPRPEFAVDSIGLDLATGRVDHETERLHTPEYGVDG